MIEPCNKSLDYFATMLNDTLFKVPKSINSLFLYKLLSIYLIYLKMPKSDIEVPKSNSSVFLFSPHPHHPFEMPNLKKMVVMNQGFLILIKECYKFMTVHQSQGI